MKHPLGALHRAILLALPAFTQPVAALAQNAAEGALEASAAELPAVTITADKVARPLEKVPASVAVVDGQDAEQSGITAMDQLEGRVPGEARRDKWVLGAAINAKAARYAG